MNALGNDSSLFRTETLLRSAATFVVENLGLELVKFSTFGPVAWFTLR